MGGITSTLTAMAPAIEGIGLGVKGYSALSAANAIESAGASQAQITQIQALQASMAADLSNTDAAMQHMLAEHNVAMDLAYAEHLLSAGEVDVAEIERQVARNVRMIQEQGGQVASQSAARAVALGVGLGSKSVMQNLENINSEIEREVVDAKFEGSIAVTKAVMSNQMSVTGAKYAAGQEAIKGIMAETQAKSQAISQRANSQVMMDVARYQEETASDRANSMRMGSFVSLLGNVGDFASKFK